MDTMGNAHGMHGDAHTKNWGWPCHAEAMPTVGLKRRLMLDIPQEAKQEAIP